METAPPPPPRIMESLAELGDFFAIPQKSSYLCEFTGRQIKQENGQCHLLPPEDHVGPPPPKGCEVFVGCLPREMTISALIPVFDSIGKMYTLRLMMDFSGTNRGYAFVTYYTPQNARRAVEMLNGYCIRDGHPMGVVMSVDNNRLFVGGLERHRTEAEIFEALSKVTDGIVRVIAYSGFTNGALNEWRNRGYAFVDYESHRAAANARRKLIRGTVALWENCYVNVDWAVPEFKVKRLLVKKLNLSTTEATLHKIFDEHSDSGVFSVHKILSNAFITFKSIIQAEKAKLALHHSEIEGAVVDVLWAKPPANNENITPYIMHHSFAGQPASHSLLGTPPPVPGNFPMDYQHHRHREQTRGTNARHGLLYPPFQQSGGYRYRLNRLHPNAHHHVQLHATSNVVHGPRYHIDHDQQLLFPAPVVFDPSPAPQFGPPITSNMAVPVLRPVVVASNIEPSEVLKKLCREQRWGEPIYNTETVTVQNVKYYRGQISVPHHSSGPRYCRSEDLFRNYTMACENVANVMLAILNSELSNDGHGQHQEPEPEPLVPVEEIGAYVENNLAPEAA